MNNEEKRKGIVMGFMGAAKGQLENNSSVTAYRVRCASVDCAAEQRFVPQSMTLIQKALENAGWVYTPGVDVGEGPTMGCWRCGPCGKLTMDNGQLTTKLAAPEAIETGTQKR